MSSNPRLLYILHQYHHLGGTELQTRLLIDHLKADHEIAVAWLDPKTRQILLRRADGNTASFPADPVLFPLTPDRQPMTERSLDELLRDFYPDIIHFQHLANWPLLTLEQATAGGARVAVSLYDYFAITPFYTMQGVADPREIFTSAYARQLGPGGLEYLHHRRLLLERGLAKADRRIVLSDSQRRVIKPFVNVDFEVIEPGIVPFAPLPKRPPGKSLRFGFLGTFVPQKGWIPLVQAFEKVRQKHPEAELRMDGARRPRGQPPAGVSLHEAFDAVDLPRICAEFDVGIIPSIFPETYCIVLSELWQSRTPVTVSDIGALSDRVTDGVNGRKFRPGDVDDIARVLIGMIEDQSWRQWPIPQARGVTDLLADHRAMYRQMLGQAPSVK